MEILQDNKKVREFLKLLAENRPEKEPDYCRLLGQLDGMGRQLEATLYELQIVKIQLAAMQESPVKKFVTNAVKVVGAKTQVMQKSLSAIKDRIIKGAGQAVEDFKRAGISALDKAASSLGVKKSLEAIQGDLSKTLAATGKSIEKIEAIGHELRSVGGHIKNTGRALTGKQRRTVDGGKEGRFQAAVLVPLRATHRHLNSINNFSLAAIGCVERLEQSAEAVREEKAQTVKSSVEEPKEAAEQPSENQAEKKTSIRKDLQEKKTRADASHPAPAKEKPLKPQEAAL